jgi:hypothetical protein
LLELFVVVLLTIAWEFWLDEFAYSFIRMGHELEDLTERLEYIVTFSVFVFIALIIPLCMIIKHVSRLEHTMSELQKVPINLKTLQSLLPICANCKKIRDDDGYE